MTPVKPYGMKSHNEANDGTTRISYPTKYVHLNSSRVILIQTKEQLRLAYLMFSSGMGYNKELM